MTKGTVVYSYGIGGPIFSGGLRNIAAATHLLGWRSLVYWSSSAARAAREVEAEVNDDDPIVVVGHSKGASFMNEFAKRYYERTKRKIDLGISVDAWFPMEASKYYKRVISIRASRFGRFDMWGANVDSHVVIDGTHTTIDDSKRLRDLVTYELAAL
jgi:alpha-beta hydrolase superfamily lysophospholipase